MRAKLRKGSWIIVERSKTYQYTLSMGYLGRDKPIKWTEIMQKGEHTKRLRYYLMVMETMTRRLLHLLYIHLQQM